MESYNPLENKLRQKVPVYVVGDAMQVGNAQDAIHGAFEMTKKL